METTGNPRECTDVDYLHNTPLKSNMTGWKIPIFNRTCIFIQGGFSIVMLVFRGVFLGICSVQNVVFPCFLPVFFHKCLYPLSGGFWKTDWMILPPDSEVKATTKRQNLQVPNVLIETTSQLAPKNGWFPSSVHLRISRGPPFSGAKMLVLREGKSWSIKRFWFGEFWMGFSRPSQDAIVTHSSAQGSQPKPSCYQCYFMLPLASWEGVIPNVNYISNSPPKITIKLKSDKRAKSFDISQKKNVHFQVVAKTLHPPKTRMNVDPKKGPLQSSNHHFSWDMLIFRDWTLHPLFFIRTFEWDFFLEGDFSPLSSMALEFMSKNIGIFTP